MTRTCTWPSSGGSPRSPATRAPAFTPRARATTRWPPTWPCWCAPTASQAQELLRSLMGVLVDLAERHLDWRMPGYTHLQRAQAVYLSHHLLAYFWKFRRDHQRFKFCMTATDDLPLGSGALAGVNFDTSRMFVAQELGFGGIAENSLDAVSNRDFVLDYLSAAATCATHLSQLGGEIVVWSSEEFGFCQVADRFASGSSLMPQKKNPDAAELLRAKAPRVAGRLLTLHGVLHGLPLTYNKDLQEDKEQLFDAIDTIELCLAVAAEMLAGTSFDRERLAAAAADEALAATDVADLLVKRGVPFRTAHGIVGGLVRAAEEQGKPHVGAEPRTSWRSWRRTWAPSSTRCSATGRGWSPRSPRAARRCRACATSSPRHAICWPRRALERPAARAACCRLLRPPGGGGGRRPRGLRAPPRRHRGPHRRNRGLPRERARLPRPHRADRPHARPVRAAGPRVRVPLLRRARAAQRRQRGRWGGSSGAHPRARSARRARHDARAARPGPRAGPLLGPGQAHPGAGHRAGPGRQRAGRADRDLLQDRGAAAPTVVSGTRIGITRAIELPWRFCDAASRCVSSPRPHAMRRSRRPAA